MIHCCGLNKRVFKKITVAERVTSSELMNHRMLHWWNVEWRPAVAGATLGAYTCCLGSASVGGVKSLTGYGEARQPYWKTIN